MKGTHMNPLEAKLVIKKLIEEHGPDCAETGHVLIVRGREPMLVDNAVRQDVTTDTPVCKVGKAGMKNGFTAGLWNEMGDLLSKAVNEAEKGIT